MDIILCKSRGVEDDLVLRTCVSASALGHLCGMLDMGHGYVYDWLNLYEAVRYYPLNLN